MITPFKEDGSVDYAALIRLVDYLLQNGADFLCVLGTTAETPTLTTEEKNEIDSDTEAVVSETAYIDENIQITITEYREYDTSIYVADIILSSPEYLQTAFAQNAYGRNVTEKTSEIAESAGAILAINGDYYGAQEDGYVFRNGVLYRNTSSSGQEDLVIYEDGSFAIINETDVTGEELLADGAQQVLSFGPALIENGTVVVSENDEVGKAKTSNPRMNCTPFVRQV